MEGLSRTLYVELPVKRKGKPKMGIFCFLFGKNEDIGSNYTQIFRMQSSQL